MKTDNKKVLVNDKKYKEIVVPHPNWELTVEDILFIEEKHRINAMMEKITRRKPQIIRREHGGNMDNLVMTQKYQAFDGRIITKELILHNDTEIPINALWDTGSTYSSISAKIVKDLGLQHLKTTFLDTSGGRIKSNVYTVNLLLSNSIRFCIDVTALNDLESRGIDFLIGMDIIHFGDFAISTYNGETCFSFRIPSKGHIDFTKS